MPDYSLAELVKRDIVLVFCFLSRENVIDDFGHISLRNPENPNRYFLSRSRSPEIVTLDDIMEFTLEGEPIDQRGRPMYSERPIHGCIFIARPDITAVAHFQTHTKQPNKKTNEPHKPLFHKTTENDETEPVWDSQPEFGDTNMLID